MSIDTLPSTFNAVMDFEKIEVMINLNSLRELLKVFAANLRKDCECNEHKYSLFSNHGELDEDNGNLPTKKMGKNYDATKKF